MHSSDTLVTLPQLMCLADKIVKTPYMADSITQGTLAAWEKKIGDFVRQDETVANIETDKVTIPVNAPESGFLREQLAKPGDTVEVGSDLFKLELSNAAPAEPVKAASENKKADVKKETPAPSQVASKVAPKEATPPPKPALPAMPVSAPAFVGERREKMTRMRLRIAERMKEAQNTAASLTTFNEADMSNLIALRNRYKELFAKSRDGLKLGFMGAFVKACATVLHQHLPIVNSRIENGDELVTPPSVDIAVAVATPKGLVTPVLRSVHTASIAQIERQLADAGERAREGRLGLEELAGGTFTISNGGVFGSLMGTPILNPPQSAILGMHAIKERPVAIEGRVEIRPMMYLALTYDHRLIDGREAVTFLVKVKELIEDPQRMLLDL